MWRGLGLAAKCWQPSSVTRGALQGIASFRLSDDADHDLIDVDTVLRRKPTTKRLNVAFFDAGASLLEFPLRQMNRPVRALFQVADGVPNVLARDLVDWNENRNIESQRPLGVFKCLPGSIECSNQFFSLKPEYVGLVGIFLTRDDSD